MQFRRVEVPSQDITWCIHAFLVSYELERTISHSNLTANKHRNEEKIWRQHFYTNASWNYFILNMAVWWGSQGGEGAEAGREETLMSNICLISHHWYMWRNLLYLAVVLYLKSCFYKLSTRNSCFTTSLFTRFLFMVTEILRKVVLFCHHSKT